ncbi:precorrin-2 C(20)-methyltransferase [Candidatus Atelocyanobacterium thalassae]|uniref:Cobalamin biosynthesis protein CobIJ n=2 Tax=Candidatus Atelocyanobacterium thalassae TaxID=713887 RepID=A0ABM7U517_9CHRO|nr:precorrin-2 C(20)-methyltransferase [Candidatus Atelocyanobacterium thalassa]BDA39759.1 cobalamin biosynthesis protein CobIJ [cyanobacterium endosymbiont of Braarudosphaera bigelowii]
MNKTTGTLYGISMGPGDPELITVKGKRLLEETPVLAFPTGILGKKGVAEEIISFWVDDKQIKLPLCFPYVKDKKQLREAWKKAALDIGNYLCKGIDVAFTCEGDINFFSTFTYLAQFILKKFPQISIKTVPGVCSPLASASALGVPLTFYSQNLAILPVVHNVNDIRVIANWANVIVLLKVSSVYTHIWDILQDLNLLQNASLIVRATQLEEKIYTDLTNYRCLSIPYFSLMVIQTN